MSKKNLVVIVTHNSANYLSWCVEPLLNHPLCQVTIVDSGSSDTAYLQPFEQHANIIYTSNVGFAKANNLALKQCAEFDSVLFLNPDARIEADAYSKLIHIITSKEYEQYHFFSVPLIGYDFTHKKNKAVYDSLGIKCNFYGRWQDIRLPVQEVAPRHCHYEAICGAFFLVKGQALARAKTVTGQVGFDENYFMYKEDIELSLRLRRFHYRSRIIRSVTALHCRGWDNCRGKVRYQAKYYSARNDLNVALRYKWRALPFALSKYLYVRFVERKNA